MINKSLKTRIGSVPLFIASTILLSLIFVSLSLFATQQNAFAAGGGSGDAGGILEGNPPVVDADIHVADDTTPTSPTTPEDYVSKQQNHDPATVNENKTLPGSAVEGGGSGSWGCEDVNPVEGKETSVKCSDGVSATVYFGEDGKPDTGEYLRSFAQKAAKQCNHGSGASGGSINIGAHINYEVIREGTFRFVGGLPQVGIRIIGTKLTSINCIDLNYIEEGEGKGDKEEVCMATGLVSVNKVIPDSKTVATKTGATSWGAGDHTYEACQESKSVRIGLGIQLKEMGRYTLDATVFVDPVTVRYYDTHPVTGVAPPPEIIHIGNRFASKTAISYAQVTCKPAYSGAGDNKNAVWRGSGWTWTAADCLDGDENNTPGQGSYTCEDEPTINGVDSSENIDLFRDNEANTVSWGNPQPSTGGPIISSTPKRTKINRSGTPWNSPRSFPANNNNFRLEVGGQNKLTSNSGTSWMPGGIFTFDTRGNWASDTGNPTKLQAIWEYDVRVMIPMINITSIYVSTSGSSSMIDVEWTKSSTPVDSTAKCYGYSNQNFVRAVND